MGIKLGLKGLTSSDRTPEDQRDVQEINAMATDSIYNPSDILDMDLSRIHPFQSEFPIDTSFANEAAELSMVQYFNQLAEQARDKKVKDEAYYSSINDIREQTRSGLNVDNKYTQEIKEMASKVSPYYKKYRFSDKLTLTTADWNELAAQYAGMHEAYGEETANQQLNQSIKDNVASNQNALEKGWFMLAGMGADAAGSMISTAGLLYGLGNAVTGNYEKNPHLSGGQNFLNTIVDNEVTRYGSDIVRYGTIANLGEAKELGISTTEIMNTSEQDKQLLSWNTPFEVVQQGGFTVASMLTGAGASKVSNLLFRGAKKGVLATTESMTQAKKIISGIQKAENFNNRVVVPGIVGSVEGVVEGLETKRGIEESGYDEAYATQRKAVEEEVMKRLSNYTEFKRNPEAMPKYYDKDGNQVDVSALYNQVWEEMKPKLDASLAHVDAVATQAGNANFLVNSAINGLINATYKAGLQSESVQKSLRKGKLTGWAFADEKMTITGTMGNAQVKPSITKLGKAWLYAKEPLGEFKEEYLQTLSDTFFTGFADSSIHSFIDAKYNGGVQKEIGDSTSEDWAAAWTEFKHGLVSKEAIKSGVYGALSSIAGTPVFGKRTNKLDENGNVELKRVKDGKPIAKKTYFGRGQSADGDKETRWEAFQRWVPWRSGLTANIKNVNARLDASKEQAQALQDWLNDPNNKEKFSGLTGSLSWMKAVQESAAVGDEYNYRNSKLGKAISDTFMLQKTEGSELYNSIMQQLVDVAYMEKDSETAKQYVQSIRDNVNTKDDSKTDDEIFNELKSNANAMLDMMSKVKEESDKIDKLVGEVDDDVKQSLIYGQLSIEDWKKRKQQLDEELAKVKVPNSVEHSTNLTDKQKKIVAQYGSIENARKEQEKLKEALASTEKDIKNILGRSGKISTQEAVKLKLLKSRRNSIKNELSNLKEVNKISEDAHFTMNEEEIMSLDPITRAQMILRAKQKLYQKLHQSTSEGGAKQEEADGNNGFTEEQKKVLDNLIAQGMAADKDFLSKIVDAGRIENATNKFLAQYTSVLMSPEGMKSYAARVKQQAADEITKDRAKEISKIQDYTEFAAALNNAFSNASRHDNNVIKRALKDNVNYQKYKEQEDTVERIVNTISKNDKFKDLDGNSADLLVRATAFLYDSGVDLKDTDAVWNALTAVDDNGYNNFVSYVNKLNEELDASQQTTFTSLEEVFQTYKDVMGQVKLDIATQERLKEPVPTNPSTKQASPTPPPTPASSKPAGIFSSPMVAKSAEEAKESLKKEKEDETESVPTNPLEQAKKDEGKPISEKKSTPEKTKDAEREKNVNAAQVETINIDQLRAEKPDSPIVAFYDKHHIRQFLSSGKINGNTDVYFITDEEFTSDVREDTQGYSNDTDLPLIAVVEDDNGIYEINGKKYQPIGVIPSSKENTAGSARMSEVRKLANTAGVSMVMFNGKPLRTKPQAGGVKANPVDNNVRVNNSLDTLLVGEMTPTEQREVEDLSKSDKRKLQSYQRVKKAFMTRMGVGPDPKTEKKSIFFRQSRMKDTKGSEENHINIFVKPIDKTESKYNNSTLLEVLGDASRIIVNFNSRTSGFARVMEKFLNDLPKTADYEAGTIESIEAKASELQKSLNRYLYLINDGSEWHYTINRVPGDAGVINEERAFTITLENNEGMQIPLATFTKDSNAEDVAADIIRNLVSDNGNWRKNEEDNMLVKWQVDYGDVEAMHNGNKQAQLNISELVDDGIFELPATSLSYGNITAVVQAPFMDNSQPRFPVEANPDNASQSASMTTDQAKTTGGATIDANSGTVLEGTAKPTQSHSAEWAKQKADEIVKGSEMFKLSDDEKTYINTKTGRAHARVTSVISADENGSRFDDTTGWELPSTSIGNTVDDLVRDFFDGTFKEEYPNMTKEDVEGMKKTLEYFVTKYLTPNNIHIVSRNVVASGTVEVTDEKGEKHSIEVAGTLDLLGYDDAGNFYIFDMKTVRDPSSIQSKKHKWSMQTSLYQKFLENTYGITVKQRFIIPIHVHYESPTKVKYEKGEGNQLIVNGKEYRGANPSIMKVTTVDYQEPKIDYNKLTDEERELAQELVQIAKDGGTTTGKEMKNEAIKAEVAESDTPIVDPTIGLPIGDMNDITGGIFNDNVDDNVLVENDGSVNTPVPGKTPWKSMTEAQRELFKKAGYTEESWNATDTKDEIDHANDCITQS